MLFNEPKLLKSNRVYGQYRGYWCFSALQRAEFAEREWYRCPAQPVYVSVLFNEPKLLKSVALVQLAVAYVSFSALQRAEIAEIR